MFTSSSGSFSVTHGRWPEYSSSPLFNKTSINIYLEIFFEYQREFSRLFTNKKPKSIICWIPASIGKRAVNNRETNRGNKGKKLDLISRMLRVRKSLEAGYPFPCTMLQKYKNLKSCPNYFHRHIFKRQGSKVHISLCSW